MPVSRSTSRSRKARSKRALCATSTPSPAKATKRRTASAAPGATASSAARIPVRSLTRGGSGTPGSTSVSNVPAGSSAHDALGADLADPVAASASARSSRGRRRRTSPAPAEGRAPCRAGPEGRPPPRRDRRALRAMPDARPPGRRPRAALGRSPPAPSGARRALAPLPPPPTGPRRATTSSTRRSAASSVSCTPDSVGEHMFVCKQSGPSHSRSPVRCDPRAEPGFARREPKRECSEPRREEGDRGGTRGSPTPDDPRSELAGRSPGSSSS